MNTDERKKNKDSSVTEGIQAILFDLGNVLIDIDAEENVRGAVKAGMPAIQVRNVDTIAEWIGRHADRPADV